jgi:DNA replication and repair protein RecF
VVTGTTGSPPVLLLDDVFSELDPERGRALVANLPPGQTVLTTASGVPPDAHPDVVLRLRGGAVTAVGAPPDAPPASLPDG